MLKKIMYVGFFLVTTILAKSALAQTYASRGGSDMSTVGIALSISAGIGMAIAALGGAISQAKVARAALEGIARNPEAANKIQTPMIIALALIESLIVYVLVIAFLLQGKV